MSAFLVLRQYLDARLSSRARSWFKDSSSEIADGVGDKRFCMLLSLASRHAKDKQALQPSAAELSAASRAVGGWNPERWTLLETLRSALVLSRTDLQEEAGALAIEDAFQFADEGEQRALYRSLGLLTGGERFRWRAGEGCRSNMLGVFEANVLDTPFPCLFFDDISFNQAAIKCVFVGVPLWRLWGLDERLSPDLCHLALDLADERRSAGRAVQGDLWLCLGEQHSERASASLMRELEPNNPNLDGAAMALYGLQRAGQLERLRELAEDPDFPTQGPLREALEAASSGASVYDYCRANASH